MSGVAEQQDCPGAVRVVLRIHVVRGLKARQCGAGLHYPALVLENFGAGAIAPRQGEPPLLRDKTTAPATPRTTSTVPMAMYVPGRDIGVMRGGCGGCDCSATLRVIASGPGAASGAAGGAGLEGGPTGSRGSGCSSLAAGPEPATAVDAGATGVPQRVQNAWSSSTGEPQLEHDLMLSAGCAAARR